MGENFSADSKEPTLVIINDTHLTDGISGGTVRAGAFRVFAEELSDLAYDASWRPDGRYEPIKELHLLLLGDILKSFMNGKTITIPPDKPDGTVADVDWNPDAEGRAPVEAHTYYLVGNHDRFSPAVQAQMGSQVPPEFIAGLREIDNIRPLADIPMWIDGLLRQTCPDPSVAKKVKDVWNGLGADFFHIPFVKNHRHGYGEIGSTPDTGAVP